jgi:cell division protein FtsB
MAMLKLRFSIPALILLVALGFLQCHLWFEKGGIGDMLHLKKQLAEQQVELETLKKHNDTLLFQVQRLQNSKDATEARARNELGMVKKGETFYQVVK